MKQTRKKIFYIVVAVSVALLAGILIVISLNMPKEEIKKDAEQITQEQEEVIKDDLLQGKNGNKEAADIIIADDALDAPPATLYENDYSNDKGYTPITDHELAKQNPANTVYDEMWTIDTWGRLSCELSTKQTVSEKAIQPILSFNKDLENIDSVAAETVRMNTKNLITKLQRNLGDRMPSDARGILLGICDQHILGPAQQ